MPSVARVEAELQRLDAKEEITERDLQQLKAILPTDPETAEIVKKGMPWPYSEVFEYVSASERQSAHWRLRPDRSAPRSAAEAETRQQFTEVAAQTTGTRGTIERDGQVIPLSAAWLADSMSGRRFSVARVRSAGQQALQRLRAVVDRDRDESTTRPRGPEERF